MLVERILYNAGVWWRPYPPATKCAHDFANAGPWAATGVPSGSLGGMTSPVSRDVGSDCNGSEVSSRILRGRAACPSDIEIEMASRARRWIVWGEHYTRATQVKQNGLCRNHPSSSAWRSGGVVMSSKISRTDEARRPASTTAAKTSPILVQAQLNAPRSPSAAPFFAPPIDTTPGCHDASNDSMSCARLHEAQLGRVQAIVPLW